jgi:hypothetical protein
MKIIRALILAAGMVFSPHLLHAQTLTVNSLNSDATPVQSATPDSVVQLTAESQGLSLVPMAELPEGGTFWMVTTDGVMAPWPCPPHDTNLPIYGIADGQFLVDATGGKVATDGQQSVADALAALSDAVVNLIGQVQDSLAGRTLARAFGMEAELDSPSGFSPMFASFDTNCLWLEITNVSNGWSYLNLHNGTNMVYAIWSTTNLLSGWEVEMEVWPTNGTVIPTVTPFSVQNLDRQNLFLRAEDWTGVDSNGDGIPDWWIWMYFGNLLETATNLDSQGNSLLYDYQHGLDPNVISFRLSAANLYANTFGAPVQVAIIYGTPSYFAVLLDDTNYADATWNVYASSNITVNLGSTEGWHQVYVGLRGLPSNAYQAWQTLRLKLDLTPPLLVITNPAPGTVTQPVIQLQGYSPEALASISYDLTNANGSVTNQQTLILGQYFDTNTMDFTTNYFQCFDVPLTNGLNTITLHATDMAGNVTTTNFNFTLDYSGATNPPTVQLGWPQAGTMISGSSFTMRGQISNPTAQVIAQIVNTNGVTNSVSGQVGRTGDFWVPGVPLSGGTNSLSVIVTDAAENTSTTTIPVIQSSLVLTISSASLGGAVTGTISDPANYTIWVNGVKATNNLDGTWIAQDPHLTLDTPTVKVRAIPNSDNGGNGGGQ